MSAQDTAQKVTSLQALLNAYRQDKPTAKACIETLDALVGGGGGELTDVGILIVVRCLFSPFVTHILHAENHRLALKMMQVSASVQRANECVKCVGGSEYVYVCAGLCYSLTFTLALTTYNSTHTHARSARTRAHTTHAHTRTQLNCYRLCFGGWIEQVVQKQIYLPR